MAGDRTVSRRMADFEKGESGKDDPKKGKDAGDLPGPNQDFFAKGGKTEAEKAKTRKGPPADMLKK